MLCTLRFFGNKRKIHMPCAGNTDPLCSVMLETVCQSDQILLRAPAHALPQLGQSVLPILAEILRLYTGMQGPSHHLISHLISYY